MLQLKLPMYDHVVDEKHLQGLIVHLLASVAPDSLLFRDRLAALCSSLVPDFNFQDHPYILTERDKIDISIEFATYVLIIELKWGSLELPSQTEMYRNVISNFHPNKEAIFLFLTRDGSIATDKHWIPVKLVPSEGDLGAVLAYNDAIELVKSRSASNQRASTGIMNAPAILGQTFVQDLLKDISQKAGFEYGVAREYKHGDKQLMTPTPVSYDGWVGKAPGTYLRLFEKRYLDTKAEFYVEAGDGLILPIVMFELLIDGLDMRAKYCSFIKDTTYTGESTRARQLIWNEVSPFAESMIPHYPKFANKRIDFHQTSIVTRKEFEQMRSDPVVLREIVRNRTAHFIFLLAPVYHRAAEKYVQSIRR